MTKEQQFLNEVKLLTDKIAANILQDSHANFVENYDHETGLTTYEIKQLAINQVYRQLAQELYLNLSKH